jgi:asparagine synthase (glutamine-hydrolysing)
VIPGELVRVDRTGVHTRRYWRLPDCGHTDDRATTIDTVRGLLEDIVDRQLVADVPLGMLLSGGLDSSVITALAARALRARGGGPVRTFAVDFEGYAEGFRPDYMRETPDTPYVAAMAAHVGAAHSDVTLSTSDLLDPGNRAAALRALDLPYARGDRDTAMYLLCQAIREHCTVALTGESADEVFGGYGWFHDPAIVAGDTFPWLAMFGHPTDDGADSTTSLLDPALLKQLDLPAYRADAYRTALAEVPHATMPHATMPHADVPHAGAVDGTVATERRMRELSYLGLTRLVPLLLERAERLSMAAPLELRVPFLDHRLVEYVFATPWAMKSFDGREKSLLRAATRDLLPAAIAERRKAPFPATQDMAYEIGLRRGLAALLDRPDSRVTALLNVDRIQNLVSTAPPARTANETRAQIELVLRLDSWLENCPVDLDLAG